MVLRKDIVSFLNEKLSVSSIKDSSVNGLQVEGNAEIVRVGLATDAALEVYQRAVKERCQMLLVHHGIIWDGLRSITGTVYQQIKYLLEYDLNLYAAHLPLDLHGQWGNNIQLAQMVGLEECVPFGVYHGLAIGFSGTFPQAVHRDRLMEHWARQLEGPALMLPFGPEYIKTMGIVSGGGGSLLNEAIEKNLDCFMTGEGVHWHHHAALEAKINVFYLGHYHTEKAGVQRLGQELEKEFAIETVFLDVPTLI